MHSWGIPSYHVKAEPSGEFISRYFEFTYADSSDVNFASANHWQRLQRDYTNLGFENKRTWFRTEIRNTTDEALALYLEVGEPLLDRIEVYFDKVQDTRPSIVLGDRLPFSNRLVDSPYFVIPVKLEAGQNRIVYFSIETTSPLNVPIRLYTSGNYSQSIKNFTFDQAFFLSASTCFIVFASLLAAVFRKPRYFYYALILSAATVGEIVRSGFGFSVMWNNWPYLNNHMNAASLGGYHASVAILFAHLVRARDRSETLSQYINGYVVTLVVATLITMQLNESVSLKLLSAFVIAGGTGMLFISIKLWRDGNKELAWFVPVWSCMLVLAYVMFGVEAGFIPTRIGVDAMIRFGFYPAVAIITVRLALAFAKENRTRIYAEQEVREHQKAAIAEKERYLQLQLISKTEEMEARQRIWQAEAENRAKGQFLATMSHEIRTPMNGVLGMTELLQNTNLDKQQRRYVDVIFSSGKSLLNIINDILDLSKINAGRMDIELIDTNVDQLCNEAIGLFTSTAEQKNILLNLDIDPATPQVISCDPVRLKQIIINLISNGLKFTTKGSVTLQIKFDGLPKKDESPTIRIEIQDTGIGIPKEKQIQLFEAFAQADKSTTREYGGTGLGLNICYQLVELMGGTIGVDSDVNKGSTFWFNIPYFEASRSDSTSENVFAEAFRESPMLMVTSDQQLASQYKAYANYLNLDLKITHHPEQYLKTSTDLPIKFIIIDADLNSREQLEHIKPLVEKYPLSIAVLLCRILQTPAQEIQEKCRIQTVIHRPVAPRTVLLRLLSLPDNPDAGSTDIAHKQEDKVEALADVSDFDTGAERSMVLVAEDNLVNQMVVNGMLKQIGVASDTVDNGRKAYEAFTKTPRKYACILMDCEMPEMDGYEATRLIREYEKAHHLKEMPILALTAHVLADAKDQFREAGMNEHLSKPINIARLKQALADHAPALLRESPATT